MEQPIKPKLGRKPANPLEGPARNYTIRLTPAQVERALQHGETINQGINALLRKNDNPDLLACLQGFFEHGAVKGGLIAPNGEPTMALQNLLFHARAAIARATGAA